MRGKGGLDEGGARRGPLVLYITREWSVMEWLTNGKTGITRHPGFLPLRRCLRSLAVHRSGENPNHHEVSSVRYASPPWSIRMSNRLLSHWVPLALAFRQLAPLGLTLVGLFPCIPGFPSIPLTTVSPSASTPLGPCLHM